ncbi:L,D-peptidoglycan transpeptidase YkuD, ErfK/YbiS/YcfS/YnhG family [Rhizobiales bacterium GAS188]|nr:L,D-peptidoglycan transpeptidase YkuD, ErfK/YbiS/YcfS/YnhG family [Rhizobiales bacterium GAS188]
MTTIPTIKVRLPRSAAATHLGTLSIGEWSTPCVVGEAGLVQASLKREGDKRTPIGVFPLRYGLFDAVALPDFPRDLAFPFVPAGSAMIWEEDGPHYNRLVLAEGDERRDERLTRERAERLFDIVVPIGYNDAVAEANRGSALFIHAAREDLRGTAGCVAVARQHLPELVRRLEPGMVIDIDHEPVSAVTTRSPGQPAMEVIRFAALEPGPKLLVTGAVHGNETCGPEAIARIIADCREGRIAVRRGEVSFVPVVNHKAYLQGTREGDRNLNRDLRDYVIPECHEDRVANLICPLLRQHDVLLDIHSFRSRGEPFVFVGPPDNQGDIEPFGSAQAEGELAARLGPAVLMHGWLAAYARAQQERARLGGGDIVSKGVGTTEYMRFAGGYGVTIECGQHQEPRAVEIAYAAIRNALAHLRLIDAPEPPRRVERAIELADAVLCVSPGDHLEKAWATGDRVPAGEVIARRADGEALTAPSDGFVVFPNADPKPLVELYYFGVASRRFGRSSES